MNKFEYTKDIDDMGYTVVENAFINHYMPKSRGDYVKVYLYGLKYCACEQEIRLNDSDIAEALNMKTEDVTNALIYWQNEGIISLEENDEERIISYHSVAGKLFFNIEYKQAALAEKRSKSAKYKKLFYRIEQLVSRPLAVNEADSFFVWMDEYKFTPDAVFTIIEDCVKRGKSGIRYWDAMAIIFHDAGVKTQTEAKDYIQKRDSQWTRYKDIMGYLGMYESPSQPQKKLMDKWFDEYKFDIDKIKLACDETIKTARPTFKYVDAVLTAWFNNTEVVFEGAKKSQKKTVIMENDHNYSPEEIDKALFGKNLLKEMES